MSDEDSKLLRAIQILNGWARNGRTWYSGQVEVVGPQGEYRVALTDDAIDAGEFHHADTPEAAQIAAADALANDYPRLLEVIGVTKAQRAALALELMDELGDPELSPDWTDRSPRSVEKRRAFNLKLAKLLADLMIEGGM